MKVTASGPDDLDLAEGRGVEDAERGAGGAALAGDGGVHVLARLREVPGAAPEGDRLEDGAVGLGPGVDRGLAGDLEGRVLVVAGEGAEGRRRVGRPEGGEADLRRRLAERVGGDHQAVDVRHLALVGRHAVGGVALDVLDRAHALADREADVLGGDVVLEVDEGLGRCRVRGRSAAPCSVTPEPVRSAVTAWACARRPRGRRRGRPARRRRRRRRARRRCPRGRGRRRRCARPRSSCRAGRPAAPRPRRGCPWCGRRGAGRGSSRRTSAPRRRRCRARLAGLAALHAVDAEGLHPQPAGGAGDGAAEQRLDAEGAGAVGERRIDGRRGRRR